MDVNAICLRHRTRVHEHQLHLLQLLHLFIVRGLRDEHLGLRCLGLLRNLHRGEEGVRRSGHGAAMRRPEKRKDEFGAVGEKDHDDLALSHAQSVEAGRHFSGGGIDVGVGVDFSGGGIDQAGA
ncbi:hypothetical protein V8G54_027220 [Vigna mungo]|uniref:Uncharacterized protein n=1 Tax=Vigna mungo TaxID=3915 RepID=A0AAQ3N1W9_VIGMU